MTDSRTQKSQESPSSPGRSGDTARPAGAAVPPASHLLRPRIGPGLGWIALAAAFVITLRLLAALPLSGGPLLMQPVLEDADYQLRVAAILQGSAFDEALPRGSALYPLLASRIPGLEKGGARPLAIAQGVLEGLTALLLMLWIRRRWGTWPAVAAGILYGIDPVGAFFAARFSPVTLGVFVWVAALWLLDTRPEGRIVLRSIVAGATAAFGFLLLPLPFFFLAVVHLAAKARERAPRRALAAAALPLAFVLLAGVALSAHHAKLRDGAPFVHWGAGVTIDAAFDPNTGGTPRFLRPPSWRSEASIRSDAWEALEREGTRADLLRFYAGRGLRRIVENPVATLGVALSKSAAAISAWPVPDALSPTFLFRTRAPWFAGWSGVSFALLFGVGLAGLLLRRSDPTRATLAHGLLAIALALLAGTVSAASRQAALPLLAALGGAFLATAVARARMRPAVFAALAAGVVASLLAGGFAPSSRLRNPSEDYRLLAARFAQNSRQAVPLLEEAVRVDPGNLEARNALSSAYQRDGLQTAAEEQLRTAYAADSLHIPTLLGLAALHQSRGETAQAVAHLRTLVALRPTNPLYMNQLGILLASENEMNEAYALFRRALVLKPDFAVAQQNLQMIETYRQRMESSLLSPEMRLPANDPIQAMLARIGRALEAERWEEADSLLTRVERDRPDLVQPHWFRAAYHARRGDLRRAVAELEMCHRIAPGRPLIVQQLAEYYFQSGQPHKVEPLIRESIEAAGRDSVRVVALLSMLEQLRRQRS